MLGDMSRPPPQAQPAAPRPPRPTSGPDARYSDVLEEQMTLEGQRGVAGVKGLYAGPGAVPLGLDGLPRAAARPPRPGVFTSGENEKREGVCVSALFIRVCAIHRSIG